MCPRMNRSLLVPMAALVVGLAATAPGDLVGHWKFDEARGKVAYDSSGNGNDGDLVGDPAWVLGCKDAGIGFDGSGDYVDCGAGASLNITGSVTVAAWIKLEGTGNDRKICGNQDGITGGYKLGIYNNLVEFEIRTASNAPVLNRSSSGGTVLEVGAWYHVVGVYSRGEYLQTYVNGRSDRRLGTSAQMGTSTGTLKLGREPFSDSYFWLGAMDDVRIYDRALTAGEIAEFTSQPKARNPSPANGATGVGTTNPILTWTKGDSAKFHDVYFGTSPSLTEVNKAAARHPSTTYYFLMGLKPAVTYYWRVDEIEADMTTVYKGDVWSFDSAPLKMAYKPSPAFDLVYVDTGAMVTLGWMPGAGAVTHEVYFGTDPVAVATATDVLSPLFLGSRAEPTISTGPLNLGTTYYWRIDELDTGGFRTQGEIWSFATSSTILIDDFETYNGDWSAGTAIYQTWIDGLGFDTTLGNGSGMTVGAPQPPYVEQRPEFVYAGNQSMRLAYNNPGAFDYSEAERTFGTSQDWTILNAEALRLLVRGQADNDPQPFYVRLEDATGKAAITVHPDPSIVLATEWTEWRIPLSQFAGVNQAAIKKMYIGVGSPFDWTGLKGAVFSANAGGGVGTIYVDCVGLVGSDWCIGFWGFVRDGEDGIANAKVTFRRNSDKKDYPNKLKKPKAGEYYVCVPADPNYTVTVKATDFHDIEFKLAVTNNASKVTVTIDSFVQGDASQVELITRESVGCGLFELNLDPKKKP